MKADELIAFSREVAERFEAKEIRGPIHLNSPTQIEPLLAIFKDIKRTDYVLSTWRSSFHALLHGIPRERVMAEILAGRSMMLHFPEYRFMSSAIVGGMLPIAVGLAAGGEKVWCFVGDMCASTGAFQDALKHSLFNGHPVNFIIEDNALSTNTPTKEAWGTKPDYRKLPFLYNYERTTQHCGTDTYVAF